MKIVIFSLVEKNSFLQETFIKFSLIFVLPSSSQKNYRKGREIQIFVSSLKRETCLYLSINFSNFCVAHDVFSRKPKKYLHNTYVVNTTPTMHTNLWSGVTMTYIPFQSAQSSAFLWALMIYGVRKSIPQWAVFGPKLKFLCYTTRSRLLRKKYRLFLLYNLWWIISL